MDTAPTSTASKKPCERCHQETPRWKVFFECWKAILEWWTFVFSVGTFLAVVFYAWTTYQQWQSFLNIESPELHIAGMSIVGNNDLAECRKHLLSDPSDSLPPDGPDAHFVCIGIENDGRRPASLRNYYFNHIVGREATSAIEIPERPKHTIVPEPTEGVWHPNSDGLRPYVWGAVHELGAITPPFHLSDGELAAFKNGEDVWIYGVLDVDMFKDHPEHIFFCGKWIKDAKGRPWFNEDRECCKKGEECPRRGN